MKRAFVESKGLKGVFSISLKGWNPFWIHQLYTHIFCGLFQGGIRAVIWNDVFQAVVMLGGLLTMLIVGTSKVGLSRVVSVLQENNRTSVR